MNDALRPRFGEQPLHAGAVGEIELVEGEAVAPLKLREPRLLQPHVVVGIEIVEPDHLVAAVEQRLGGVVSDEAGGAGDEDIACVLSLRMGRSARVSMPPGDTASRR